MRVLFVASGNSPYYDIAPFIESQADALRASGVEVDYFLVKGRGAANYLKNAGRLRKYLSGRRYDLIHAHYGLCGWVAVLGSRRTPVVLSLMGDDAQGDFFEYGKIDWRSLLLVQLSRAVQPFVKAIIIKSPNLQASVFRKKIMHLIPNGVRLEQFRLMGRECRQKLGLREDKQYVLFLADPELPRKNIALARSAIGQLNRPDIELVNVYRAPHDEVVDYLNAVDVMVLCSFGEGSPNVVKEAMACNCPVVATDVGDVRWVIEGVPGCFLASFEAEDFAQKLHQALEFARAQGRTKGRQRILELGLDAAAVNQRLLEVYRSVLPKTVGATAVEYE